MTPRAPSAARLLPALATLVPLFASTAFAQHAPPPATPVALADTSRTRRWAQDVDFVADRVLTLHPRPFGRCSRAAFDSAHAAILAHVSTWNDARLGIETMRWVAMLQDGHTMAVATFPPLGFDRVMPLVLRPCEDGLFVAAAAPEYATAVGAKVVGVGSLDADAALARVRSITSGDHDRTKLDRVPLFMMLPAAWKALGATDDEGRVTFELERAGERERVTVAGGAPPEGFPEAYLETEPRIPATWKSARRLPAAGAPRCDQRPGDAWWFEVLPDSQVLYLRMRRMDAISGGRTVAEFYRELFATVDRVRPRALVVDLRHDHGGSNNIVDALVRGIVQRPWLDRPGGVYAMIDRGTFSAAMNAAVFLEAQTRVTFVGEPTAGGLNHYGDAAGVHTPNVGMLLQVSTVPWLSRFPQDGRPWIAPQIAAPSTWADWSGGRDTALEAVLDAVAHGTPYERALEAAKQRGADAGLEALNAWRAAHPNPWETSATDLAAKYEDDLQDAGRWADAVAFADVLVKRSPDSALAWRLAGSAHEGAGDRAKAIECYRRTLALNPRAQVARMMLERLGEKP